MKIAVTIGRFQPFHNGHEYLLKAALKENDLVIVVLGSSNRHRSIKNPFTIQERKEMIMEWADSLLLPNVLRDKLRFVESPDNLYKEWTWKSEIVRRVNDLIPSGVISKEITLYGHHKDNSSYYLREFPEWKLRNVLNFGGVEATGVRDTFLEGGIVPKYVLPETTVNFMQRFKKTNVYDDLLEEWDFYKKEADKFDGYPYPETIGFMCSDAVVICKGHVLLIQRKNAPGKGSWALPGGFKNRNETFEQTCIRELKEETNLRIPEKVLLGSIKGSNIFDHPSRNLGIPRVSMAYHLEVNIDDDGSLPTVRPASDAYEAKWFQLSEACAMNLFDDHLDIIKFFV